jgi:DNA-binding response OmpR family regulator
MAQDKTHSILIVEDNLATQEMLAHYFAGKGFITHTADDGMQALNAVECIRPDIILLDVIVPLLDGFKLLEKIRKQGILIPVIMLTDQRTIDDKVRGLEFGADDYVTKPFDLREVLARVNARLRSAGISAEDQFRKTVHTGDITIYPKVRKVFCQESLEIFLTKTEFDILHYLAVKRDEVVGYRVILKEIMEYDAATETKAVAMHIANIRRKLAQAGDATIRIKAISGVGYRLMAGPP